MAKKYEPPVGQYRLDGTMYGLEKIVTPPEVIEDNGLKVLHLAISEDDAMIPDFVNEALRQARMLIPEVKSKGRPPWLTQEWQVRRRKKKWNSGH